jgi:hypothetical protein
LHATTAHAAAFKRVKDFFTFSGAFGGFGDALVKVYVRKYACRRQ